MRSLLYRTSLIGIAGFVIGLFLSRDGIVVWDDWEHILQSQWLLAQYGGPQPPSDPTMIMKWYGPLWELVMGFFSFVVFGFLKDPAAVRHALTFMLFPLTLWGVYVQLRNHDISKHRSLIACAVLFGIIRWGGHALINTKDFPFSAAFLFVTLYSWTLLKREIEQTGFRWKRWVWVGIVAIVPYLLRPPVALHIAVIAGFIVLFALLDYQKRRSEWLKAFGTMLLSAFAFILLTYPAVRQFGFGMWMESFSFFGKFPWLGPVRVFGTTYRSDELPFWYPFGWIPVITSFITFAYMVLGLICWIAGKSPSQASALKVDWKMHSFRVDIRYWLALFTGLAWAAVLVKHPVLYDEERHILFLYPPLVLLLALQIPETIPFEKKPNLKGTLLFVLALTLYSYIDWGKHSYVFKSPVVGNIDADRFMGDYWGECVGPTMTALKGRVPSNSFIAVIGPSGIAPVQLDRLQNSLLFKQEGFESMHAVDPSQLQKPAVIIATNRLGTLSQIQQMIQAGAAQHVTSIYMEPLQINQPACIAALLP